MKTATLTANEIANEIVWMLLNTMQGSTPEQALNVWEEESNLALPESKRKGVIAKIEW